MPKPTGAVGLNVSLWTETLAPFDDHSTNARRSFDPAEAARLADMLRVKPGQRSWLTKAKIAARDELISELAARFYPGSKNRQAECIHRDLVRYAGSTWRRTRSDEACRHGDVRLQLFWRILKARDRVPGVRCVNQILAGRS